MTGPAAPGPLRGVGVRRWGLPCLVVSALVLPALVVGAGVGEPASADELAVLRGALQAGEGSDVARHFLLAALPGAPTVVPAGEPERAAFVATARLAQVCGVFGATLLLYLLVLLARGRLHALLACGLLAALPPVAERGHVLRPETAAVLFVGLAALLMQCLANAGRGPRRGSRRQPVVRLLLACSIACCLGLSVAVLPALGGCLLLPGVVMIVLAVQLGVRALRIRRTRTWYGVPARAINARLWPWTLTAVLGPVAGLWLLTTTVRGPVEAVVPTPLDASLLPAVPLLHLASAALAVVGGVFGILRVGLRFGRRGRIGADFVLLAYCGTQLAYAASRGGAHDSLPAAPAMAAVLAEGAFVALGGAVLLGWRRRRRTGG